MPGAAEFQLVEDQRDRRLDAPIRILLVTIADLDEPDRSADRQPAAACLLVARRQGSLAQQIQRVLVEAALQPEQQPIVAVWGA